MVLSHNTLLNYYYLMFNLAQHHNYSITEIESLMPFERDIYVGLLQKHIADKIAKMESR